MTTALALTTSDLLTLHVGPDRDRIAVAEAGRQFSYGELQGRVDSLAAELARLGVARGDRVVVHLRKSVEEVVAMFAAWRIGAVAVNVNAQWTMSQLQYVVEDSGARVGILDARRAKEWQAQRPCELAVVVAGTPPVGPGFHPWPNEAATPPERHLLDVDVAAILYTSGSTGKPKGVVLSHTHLLVGARSVARYTKQTGNDRLLSLLPLSFDYGLNQVLTAFLVGARVVLQAVAFPSAIVKTIIAEDVTGFAAVPPVWIQMETYLREVPTELPALRYITNSGGKIPDSTLRGLPTVFPNAQIYLMYGLTEAFRSTFLSPSRFAEKMGSMGRAVPNVETFVVVEGRGLANPGEVGELVHRGSFISRGYWGRPEATAEKIRPAPELAELIGDEKVVWSGDLVRVDEDGDLWFVGRADGMIKSMGFRISPTEVEDVLYGSGLISQCIAFGTEDTLAGQVVQVAVVLENGATLTDVEVYSRTAMPHYMKPRRFFVWSEEMPRTASGKLDVPAVIKECRHRMSEDDRTS